MIRQVVDILGFDGGGREGLGSRPGAGFSAENAADLPGVGDAFGENPCVYIIALDIVFVGGRLVEEIQIY